MHSIPTEKDRAELHVPDSIPALNGAGGGAATGLRLTAEDQEILDWAADGLEIAEEDCLGPHDEIDRAKIARLRFLASHDLVTFTRVGGSDVSPV